MNLSVNVMENLALIGGCTCVVGLVIFIGLIFFIVLAVAEETRKK